MNPIKATLKHLLLLIALILCSVCNCYAVEDEQNCDYRLINDWSFKKAPSCGFKMFGVAGVFVNELSDTIVIVFVCPDLSVNWEQLMVTGCRYDIPFVKVAPSNDVAIMNIDYALKQNKSFYTATGLPKQTRKG